jgi:hypothetical protein
MSLQPPPYGPPHGPPHGPPQGPPHGPGEGAPSGYPPGQQPHPRKTRPSAWWFGLGLALIGAAVVAGVALFVWTLHGFLATDVDIARDGRPHRVEVSTDGDRMLWAPEYASTPACRVVDRATGDEVPLRGAGGDFRRSDGGAGDWRGLWRFDPGSGSLEITCDQTGSRPSSTVEIGPSPRIGSFLLGILATILVPAVLGLSGVVVLIVTGILYSTRPART